jgi:glycosyltransferase involved in cell wall biosynthesis
MNGLSAPRSLTSVIVIFFNPGEFLQEAIESVFAQTDSGWELLLVDDGSTDRSTGVAKSYAQRFPDRVRYFEHVRHENLGMSASRNLGLRHATGDLVAFLDADDVWFPNKLREQKAILEAQPSAGMLVGRYEVWFSWKNNPNGFNSVSALAIVPDTLVLPPHLALTCYPLGKRTAPSMSDLIARKHIIYQVGGFEPRFRGMYEDQAFLLKMYLSTPIYVSSSCWSRYRQHERSCCHVTKAAGQWENSRSDFLYWCEGYFQTHTIDAQVRAALHKAMWPYRHPLLDRAKRGCLRVARLPRKIARITKATAIFRALRTRVVMRGRLGYK